MSLTSDIERVLGERVLLGVSRWYIDRELARRRIEEASA